MCIYSCPDKPDKQQLTNRKSNKNFLFAKRWHTGMTSKIKGTNAERELIHLFWAGGWAAVRVAGSGSSKYPSPDILAGNNIRKLAIECKAIKGNYKYFIEEQINNLIMFAQNFGAEAWVGVRFDNQGWFFFGPEELRKTANGMKVTLEYANRFGILFEELIK
jgi:Holliday junction resolvase